jgi:hypothetical protein
MTPCIASFYLRGDSIGNFEVQLSILSRFPSLDCFYDKGLRLELKKEVVYTWTQTNRFEVMEHKRTTLRLLQKFALGIYEKEVMANLGNLK